MKVKIVFSISTRNESDVEEAARELANSFLHTKQIKIDTLVVEREVEDAGYFLLELLTPKERTAWMNDELFDKYGITIDSIKVDHDDNVKNESRTKNLESRKPDTKIKESKTPGPNYKFEDIQDTLISIGTLCPDITLETQELVNDLLKDFETGKYSTLSQSDAMSVVDNIDEIADNLFVEGYEDYAEDLWDSVSMLRQSDFE